MISQVSNNRPSGSTAKQCDAGIPVVGRTDATGQYQILKVNPDGSLVSTAAQVSTGVFLQFAAQIPCATGALAANTLIAKTFLGAYDAGLYRINPAFVFDGGATTGGITFVLYNSLGSMFTYVSGLIDGSPFAPVLNAVAPNGGVAGYWHNSAVQSFGTGLEISYNRNNTLDVYLDTDQYFMAMISDGAVNIATPFATFGCIEITKLG